MQINESKANSNRSGLSSSSSSTSQSASHTLTTTTNNNSGTTSIGKSNSNNNNNKRTNDDAKQAASVMSNLSYSLIDDDHIDDEETINVGNLIIDLESDLERGKIGTDQQQQQQQQTTNSNSKTTACTTTTGSNAPTSSSSSIAASSSNKFSSSSSSHSLSSTTNNSSNNPSSSTNSTHNTSGKSNQKSFAKQAPTTNSSGSMVETSSIFSTRECGTSTSVGTITEPECLGPCEPGTSVTLEGIVWQETEGGILVVNVTWRGKTYVGALLDCTKHDWAPPRLCDSPASDVDLKSHKGVRAKRIVTRSNGIGVDEKNLLQPTGKLRNGKGRRILTSSDVSSCSKKARDSEKPTEFSTSGSQLESGADETTPISISESMQVDTLSTNNEVINARELKSPASPALIGCSEPNCSKKYRDMNGLLYHRTHAHSSDNEPQENNPQENNPQDNNCSVSSQDKAVVDDHQPGDAEKLSPPPPPPPLPPLPPLPPQPPRRNLSNSRRSPGLPRHVQPVELGPGSSNHTSSSLTNHHSSSSSNHGPSSRMSLKQQTNQPPPPPPQQQQPPPPPPPIPMTTEEGMKPSGTSTGPPPAPHQANCFFNTGFMASMYGGPSFMSPYLQRPSLPMYDPIAPPISSANANVYARMMSNMRGPPTPEAAARLPIPTSQMGPSQPLGGLPLLPSVPITHSQPPFPPPSGMNPPFGLPLGSIGGPQVPRRGFN